MKILGIKLTHDSAITVIEDGAVKFSMELEKFNNNLRYSKFKNTDELSAFLENFGFKIGDFDSIVIDGWKTGSIDSFDIEVSQYHEFLTDGRKVNIFNRDDFTSPFFGEYSSYPHMLCHIIGAYSASPFSKNKNDCAVLNWDGGQNCRLHMVSPRNRSVEYIGSVHNMYSTIYSAMGYYFGPYAKRSNITGTKKGQHDWPGKLMGYISTGVEDESIQKTLNKLYSKHFTCIPMHYEVENSIRENNFLNELSSEINSYSISDSDVMYNIHIFIQRKITSGLKKLIDKEVPIAFTGGSALNIKWNNAIKDAGYEVWIPPFPNDCGNSFGAACCELALTHDLWSVDWDVYCGSEVIDNSDELYFWEVHECDVNGLAKFLADNPNEPVVVLHGKCEFGPRALGHRSIICSATSVENKHRINRIKNREIFRPVAPICLEESSKKIFTPGGNDPYMIFEHKTNEKWKGIIPAVVHLDGTARLQTVSCNDSPFVYSLLKEYDRLTGIPVLCNTSANYNGSGFFPDVVSASKLDGIDYIWCNNKLIERV